MKRRHPALDYRGMCPFANARHCEMRIGCATFASSNANAATATSEAARGTNPGPRAAVSPLTICYEKEERLGWEGLASGLQRAMTRLPAPTQRGTAASVRATVVVSSGHHHPPTESLFAALERRWAANGNGSASASVDAVVVAARSHRARFLAAAQSRPDLRVLFQEAEPQVRHWRMLSP